MVYTLFFINIISLFFLESNKEKNISLFLSFIPFYYGAFLAFANYAEFARLMMPIIPLIIYNYLKPNFLSSARVLLQKLSDYIGKGDPTDSSFNQIWIKK